MVEVAGWIGAVGSVVANALVIKKKPVGFKLWSIATGILLIVAIINQQWSQAFLFSVYEALNIYGWISWRGLNNK